MALKSTPQFGPAPYGPIHDQKQKELAKEAEPKPVEKVDRAAKAREVLAQKRALGLIGKRSKKAKKK